MRLLSLKRRFVRVAREANFCAFQFCNLAAIFFLKLKVKDARIFYDALGRYAFWQWQISLLQAPADANLRDGAVVFLREVPHERV